MMAFKDILLAALGLQRRADVMPPPPRDEKIIRAIEPWMLACAVGAENGTTGSICGFDMWFRISRENWVQRVKARTGASEKQIEKTIRAFVAANKSRHYQEVLEQYEAERGSKPSMVIGPGESKTVTMREVLCDEWRST